MSEEKDKFTATWFYSSVGRMGDESDGEFDFTKPDFEEYARGIANAYNEMDADGYDVVNVIPIAMGSGGYENPACTRGAVIVGKARD